MHDRYQRFLITNRDFPIYGMFIFKIIGGCQLFIFLTNVLIMPNAVLAKGPHFEMFIQISLVESGVKKFIRLSVLSQTPYHFLKIMEMIQ